MKLAILSVVVLALSLSIAQGHIRVREPPNRSSIWRDPRFTDLNPVENLKDDGIYCKGVLQLPEVSNCGVCGDSLTETVPRPNEHGGIYGQGIITGNYTSGQAINVAIEITIPHSGSFHFQLCDQIPETDGCFSMSPLLNITTPEGTMTDIPVTADPTWVNGTVHLPAGVSCEHCVLRLNYRGASELGDCEDGTSAYGCGLQQNFRSCSDISISA